VLKVNLHTELQMLMGAAPIC